MDEAFHARLEFDKGAVGHEIDHFTVDLRAHGELVIDIIPRIILGLLQAEGHPLFLAVDVDDHDLNFFALLQHLRRMANAAPAHVRDV